MIWVSSVQLYDNSSVYCIVCSPPKVQSSIMIQWTLFSLHYLPHPTSPLFTIILLSVSEFLFTCSIHLLFSVLYPT